MDMQVERVANTEPVSIDVPAVSDLSKASVKGARQLSVSHFLYPVSDTQTATGQNSASICFYHAVVGLHKGMVSICSGDKQTAPARKART